MNDGLIDEIHFVISPVALGEGPSIFSQKSLVPLILMYR
ncbi:MAG: dihydrofolate reductase family protein, partial [Nitrososphaeraceae archaeon]